MTPPTTRRLWVGGSSVAALDTLGWPQPPETADYQSSCLRPPSRGPHFSASATKPPLAVQGVTIAVSLKGGHVPVGLRGRKRLTVPTGDLTTPVSRRSRRGQAPAGRSHPLSTKPA
jgi:hypothetical protein